MILHAFLTAPETTQPQFRGRDLSFWYPRLFPRLDWLGSRPLSAEALVAIWNTVHLYDLDRFEGWFASLSLPPLDSQPWFSLLDGALYLIRADALTELLLGPSLSRDSLPSTVPLPLPSPDTPLPCQSNRLEIERTILSIQIEHYTRLGVVFTDPAHVYIEGLPPIGSGSSLHHGVVIEGDSEIGESVRIAPHVHLVNASIGSGSQIHTGSLIYDSQVASDTQIGPYAHLRAGSLIGQGAKIGNFVEVKKSRIGPKTKAMHLSYLGDATIGEAVNIGAGTITCNYDGRVKNPTIIEDRVFVGSGTELVAPVTLEADSYVAAGSTITETVPADSLAIARMKQRNIADWSSRRRKTSKD